MSNLDETQAMNFPDDLFGTEEEPRVPSPTKAPSSGLNFPEDCFRPVDSTEETRVFSPEELALLDMSPLDRKILSIQNERYHVDGNYLSFMKSKSPVDASAVLEVVEKSAVVDEPVVGSTPTPVVAEEQGSFGKRLMAGLALAAIMGTSGYVGYRELNKNASEGPTINVAASAAAAKQKATDAADQAANKAAEDAKKQASDAASKAAEDVKKQAEAKASEAADAAKKQAEAQAVEDAKKQADEAKKQAEDATKAAEEKAKKTVSDSLSSIDNRIIHVGSGDYSSRPAKFINSGVPYDVPNCKPAEDSKCPTDGLNPNTSITGNGSGESGKYRMNLGWMSKSAVNETQVPKDHLSSALASAGASFGIPLKQDVAYDSARYLSSGYYIFDAGDDNWVVYNGDKVVAVLLPPGSDNSKTNQYYAGRKAISLGNIPSATSGKSDTSTGDWMTA